MTTPLLKILSQLKPLWVLLTGGAFVSFAGGALVLFYFLGIGGVPIGQAASFGAIAKVVVPMAILLGISFLLVWLAPMFISFTFVDYQSFSKILRHFFTATDKTDDLVRLTENIPHSAQKIFQVIPIQKISTPSETYTQKNQSIILSPYSPARGRRVLLFSILTVGMGCFAAIFYALHANQNATEGWTRYAGGIILVGWAFVLLFFLVVMWLFFNKPSLTMLGIWRQNAQSSNFAKKINPRLPAAYIFLWIFFGFLSSAISTTPLFYLVLVFLRSDYLLATQSFTVFIFGTIIISMGIIFVYALSLITLIERIQGKPTKWGLLLALNASILGLMVFMLGMSSRMLEAVMVMASVRAENAVITLEPEGCELLQAMGAKGWGYPSKNSRTCVLYDVTIQSTLEPAMQIACWRGTIPQKTAQDAASLRASERHSKAAPSDPMTASEENGIATASTTNPAPVTLPVAGTTEITGQRGAFTIPVKHIRSVWKTGGARTSKGEALCATSLDYLGQ